MIPTWVATLETGERVIGMVSWGTSGLSLRAPEPGKSDWSRLKTRCEEENLRLRELSVFFPGLTTLAAPEGKGAYGLFEQWAMDTQGRGGCEGVGICWPENKGRVIKVQIVKAGGIVECWDRWKWQPCMIGPNEWELGKDN